MKWQALIFGLCLITGTVVSVEANEPSGAQSAVVGSTVKTLARAYIATAKLDEIKDNSIEKLNRMGLERYKWEYAHHYKVLKDLPLKLKNRYGIVPELPREKMVGIIRSLEKKQIYEIVEAIPNETITREVTAYIDADGERMKGKSFMEKVHIVWGDIMHDMGSKPPARSHQ